MAIATDQGSNMSGPERGLAGLLKERFPDVSTFNDLSHIIFKYSNQKKAGFKHFQEARRILLKLRATPKLGGYLSLRVSKEQSNFGTFWKTFLISMLAMKKSKRKKRCFLMKINRMQEIF